MMKASYQKKVIQPGTVCRVNKVVQRLNLQPRYVYPESYLNLIPGQAVAGRQFERCSLLQEFATNKASG